MDARNLSEIENEAYDAIIDKGTMDCLICGHYQKAQTLQFLSEVHRHGLFFAILFSLLLPNFPKLV
jgi:hypothetical protein